MRSVDEVFRPVLLQPTLVSESPRGYSQSMMAGPHFESQTNLTQIFLRADCSEASTRCENLPSKYSGIKKRGYTHKYIQRSVTPDTLIETIMPIAPQRLFVIYALGQSSVLSCQNLLESMAENMFLVNNPPHHAIFFILRTN